MLSTQNVRGERERALTAGGQGPLAIYALAARHQLAPGTDQLGTVRAISAETGETSWLYEQRAATMSLVATGRGLIFGGDASGRFRAFDRETGDVLWEINLGSPVAGYPDQLCRRRTPVRGRQHRRRCLDQPPDDARAPPESRERFVRVCPAGPRLNRRNLRAVRLNNPA